MPHDLVTATFGSSTTSRDLALVAPRLGLLSVADAPGATEDARAAARAALEAVRIHLDLHAEELDRFRANPASELRAAVLSLVEEAFTRAAADVFAFARRRAPDLAVALDVVLLLDHEAFVGHVGDGRVYLVRRGLVHQLTVDHVGPTPDGVFHADSPASGPGERRLQRSLGPEPSVKVEALTMEILPGDRFVSISGELCRALPDVVLHAAMLTEPVPDLGPAFGAKTGEHGPFALATAQIGGGEASGTAGAGGRLAALIEIPLFRHCTERELKAIAGVTTPRVIEPGVALFHEAETGDALYLLMSGEVRIERGGTPIVTLSAGSHFGEMALLDEPVRSASAVAASRVEVLAITREKFFGLLRQQPNLAVKILWNLLLQLSTNLRATSAGLAEARRLLAEARDVA